MKINSASHLVIKTAIYAVVFGSLCSMVADAKPKSSASTRLKVGDIAGRYVASSPKAFYKTISISFIGKTSKSGEFEQGDFRGEFGGNSFVGQGIISGDEGGLDDFVRFDFMFLNPQDTTSMMYSTSIMSKGKVVGMLINSVKYLRAR